MGKIPGRRKKRVLFADQPSRLRTPPGVGVEGWPISLLCARNARPKKALVGRAQSETNRPTHYIYGCEPDWWEHWKTIGSQVNATRKKNFLVLDGKGEMSELGGSIIIWCSICEVHGHGCCP